MNLDSELRDHKTKNLKLQEEIGMLKYAIEERDKQISRLNSELTTTKKREREAVKTVALKDAEIYQLQLSLENEKEETERAYKMLK